MKLRTVIVTLILILTAFTATAQLSKPVVLNWGAPASLLRGEDDPIDVLSFGEAQYLLLPESNLPSIVVRIPLPEGFDFAGFRLENIYYEPFTETEHTLLGGESLPRVPDASAEVMFERGRPWVYVTVLPFGTDPGTGLQAKVSGFTVSVDTYRGAGSEKQAALYPYNSVLASGDWYKIYIKESGIYKLTYDDLSKLGMPLKNLNPAMIRLYGNGGRMLNETAGTERINDLAENAIRVVTAKPGVFAPGDYILFYGLGPNTWTLNPFSSRMEHNTHLYSDEGAYFLTIGLMPGKRIPEDQGPAEAENDLTSSYTDMRIHENDNINLVKSGRKWFGEKLDFYTRILNLPSFRFNNPVAGENVVLRYGLAARSTKGDVTFNILVNGENVASPKLIKILSDHEYAKEVTEVKSIPFSSDRMDVRIQFNPVSNTDLGFLDFVSLNVRCALTFSSGQMAFRDPRTVGEGKITRFNLENANTVQEVWDVSDPVNVRSLALQRTGSQATFKRNTEKLVEMIAFDGTSFLKVRTGEKIRNQNLHALGNYDMVILTHPDFAQDAKRLAHVHNDRGEISAVVVSIPEVYNEFSSGIQDITAIRDFMKLLYDRGKQWGYPKYLLLVGNASYDVKNRIPGNTIFIPTFQSENAVHYVYSFLSDDYFGILDDGEGGLNASGLLDIGVGRLPVRTPEQSRIVVDKLIYYLENNADTHGDWRNTIVVPADDRDRNTHLDQAEKLVDTIELKSPDYNIHKIYFDSYVLESTPGGARYPDVNREIATRVEKGALMVNYIGHGGEVGWADERVLEIQDINAWTNYDRMGLFFTATCEFSRFDNPLHTSAGELVFLNPNGGAMSLVTTTRLAFASNNSILNLHFADTMFSPHTNVPPRLGDALRYTKNRSPNSQNTRHLTLFGDPSMRLPMPRFHVATTGVKNPVTGAAVDTLFANTLATVSGEIRDDDDMLMNNFDGIVYVKVFDKPSVVTTLGQQNLSFITQFNSLKNVLYQGKATVTGGKFEITFPVPRDIDFSYGQGKLSYYATNGVVDANGFYTGIRIGGAVQAETTDTEGPVIRLFMNDTNFVDGGLTSEFPRLVALLYDESGINTLGTGIGHDITATMDGDGYSSVVLNDFYVSDKDSYRSGRVNYQYFNLPEGEHTLSLKAWDVHNNSSTASIRFVVQRNIVLSVEGLTAYPNPSGGDVYVRFDHNLFDGKFDVEMQVFNSTGQLIRSIGPERIVSEGYVSGSIHWDGRSDDGIPARAGLYLCRLTIRDRNGYISRNTAKIILVR